MDDLLSLLAPYVKFAAPIVARRNNVAGFCPFHGGGTESNPSLYLYVGRSGIFAGKRKTRGDLYCHTCGRSWSLEQAVGQLTGTRIPRGALALYTQEDENFVVTRDLFDEETGEDSLPILSSGVLGFFEWCPLPLISAGFTEETLRKFDIGFDTRHGRITFPIFNRRGELVGVSGRTVMGSTVRYKIYKSEWGIPGYELDKSKVVWNIHRVVALRKKQAMPYLILCEGFKAVMWLDQNGHPNTVCVLGTHLSDSQVVQLRSLTERLVLFMDNDKAGILATFSALQRVQKHFSVTIARYTPEQSNKSPDDLTQEELNAALESRLFQHEWLYENAAILKEAGRDPFKSKQR